MRRVLKDNPLALLEGRRVGRKYPCVYCLATDGVLRRHYALGELELYCDSCERWTGLCLTVAVEPERPAQTMERPVYVNGN